MDDVILINLLAGALSLAAGLAAFAFSRGNPLGEQVASSDLDASGGCLAAAATTEPGGGNYSGSGPEAVASKPGKKRGGCILFV